MLNQKEKDRLSKISALIYQGSKQVRILRHLSWSEKVKHDFFDNDCEILPKVTYPLYDESALKAIIADAEKHLHDTKYDLWFKKKVIDIKKSSSLLVHCGQKEFFNISKEIYGDPGSTIRDSETMPIDLSVQFENIINSISHKTFETLKSPKISSDIVANKISKSVKEFFDDSAPKIKIVDALSAKATATSKTIKIRKNGDFDKTDIDQLLNHEAYIHVATTLNGRMQSKMKILASNYGGITKTQEGLAVFSEFITGSIDVDRMRRISDRAIAIQMSIDGANFIDVYRFFLQKNNSKNQAFESARRVFRGGLITGRAPFTKDIVYLDGFIRVYNFFRSAISQGKVDALILLFSGKMDLDDIPIIYSMHEEELISKPRFIPPWIQNLNYLICNFSFSVFLEKINYEKITEYYSILLRDVK